MLAIAVLALSGCAKESPGPAKASSVAFVDAVPSTLPPQGVRILPFDNILLMPTSVDPATLAVSTAQQAIADAPPVGQPGTAQAVLAKVTVGAAPDIVDRVLWVVTHHYDEPVQAQSLGGPQMKLDPDENWVNGALFFIDPQTGEMISGSMLFVQTPRRKQFEDEMIQSGKIPQPQLPSSEPQSSTP